MRDMASARRASPAPLLLRRDVGLLVDRFSRRPPRAASQQRARRPRHLADDGDENSLFRRKRVLGAQGLTSSRRHPTGR